MNAAIATAPVGAGVIHVLPIVGGPAAERLRAPDGDAVATPARTGAHADRTA